MSRNARFPCCICAAPLEVRETKKGKPYVICDPCGMQMFVRNGEGIHRFEILLSETKNIWMRLARVEQRYKKKCPACGHEFLSEDKLIKTSVMNGAMLGYQCPKPGCKGIAKAEVTVK